MCRDKGQIDGKGGLADVSRARMRNVGHAAGNHPRSSSTMLAARCRLRRRLRSRRPMAACMAVHADRNRAHEPAGSPPSPQVTGLNRCGVEKQSTQPALRALNRERSPIWNLMEPSSSFSPFSCSQPPPLAGSISSLPSQVKTNRCFGPLRSTYPSSPPLTRPNWNEPKVLRPDLDERLRLHVAAALVPHLHGVDVPGADERVLMTRQFDAVFGHGTSQSRWHRKGSCSLDLR